MRPRLATICLGGCMGCHVSLLDAHERLVELLGGVELVHSPLIDVPELPECDVVLVEGAVATEHDAEVLLDARAKSRTLVAIGACATLGGVGGLRNVLALDDVLAAAYGAAPPSSDSGDVPALLRHVRRVSDVVAVDYEVPGCAPTTEALLDGIAAALTGAEDRSPRRNLCAECGRRHVKMLEHDAGFVSDAVYSVMELDEIDPDVCLVEQGVVCMGPMTREGCGARCTAANVPCRGCMGPSRPDFEQGAKMVDALAAVLPAGAIMFLDDLIGTGYRFSLPASVIPAAYDHGGGDDA